MPLTLSAENNRGLQSHLVHRVLIDEAERRRLSREMHDALGQKIALLDFQIEALKRTAESDSQIRGDLESLQECVGALGEDLHRLCYQLHPVMLDRFGLVRGLEHLCEEQTRIGPMKVEFVHGRIAGKIPSDVALCLYRVAQEGVQNAAKHSGCRKANVELTRQEGGLRLTVTDSGCGFDANAPQYNPGLGLQFMGERVKLLGGWSQVRSVPGAGTRITACLPLAGRRSKSAPPFLAEPAIRRRSRARSSQFAP